MKAIFQGQEYYIVEDTGDGVLLEPLDGDEDTRFAVSYGDSSLIVDPTDGELDAAKAWRERMPRRGTDDPVRYLEVESSHGSLIVDRKDGVVLRELSRYHGDELMSIVRFDLDEWEKHYNQSLPRSLDILDLGYWIVGGVYEPPAHEWRKDRAENSKA